MKLPTDAQQKKFTYDDWLEFFRKAPVSELLESQHELRSNLSTEGFAAAARWIEIISNPSKMDKLYSARLKAQSEESIMDVAVGDDDEAFYEALIRESVTQLNSSAVSAQEVARLTQNINIFRKELREIRSRKPKEGTVLEKVLKKANMASASSPAATDEQKFPRFKSSESFSTKHRRRAGATPVGATSIKKGRKEGRKEAHDD